MNKPVFGVKTDAMITEVYKKMEKEYPDVYIHGMSSFLSKISVTKSKNQLHLTLTLPADEILHDPTVIDDFIRSNVKMVPLLLLVKNQD